MKKTLLLVTILMSFFAQGMKADEYTTVIEEMVRSGVVAGLSDSNLQQFKSMAPKMADYLNGQFITDVAEIYAPYYRQNCTVDEMKQMSAYLSSPENKALMQKMYENTKDSEADMSKELKTIMQSIMTGGTPDDLKPAECSKELSDALDKLYATMELDKLAKATGTMMTDMLNNSLKQMLTQMVAKMGGESVDQSTLDAVFAQMEAPMKAMATYMDKNMPTMMRNIYIKTLTVDDINQLLKIQDQSFYPSFKRVQAAMYDDMPNAMNKMMDLIMPKVTDAVGDMIPGAKE